MGWWWLCAVCCLAVVVGMDPCDEQESAELWQQSVSNTAAAAAVWLRGGGTAV